LAPVIADQVGYRAQLILPPEDVVESGDVTARLQRVDVEVIDAPAFAGTAPQQIAEAIRAGRRAVEHERLGQAREATTTWLLCAGLWRSAGDEERAAKAERLSREGATALRGAARISGSMASRSPAAEP
jgi:hypothetical protein